MLLLAATSCKEPGKQAGNGSQSGKLVFQKGIDLQPQMKKTDSVQTVFYKDPDDDPERYTRYYYTINSIDTGFVNRVLRGLNQSFQELEKVKDCRSEGKMYLFKRGADDPLQTIYFSTRCDSCCYVYFIRHGRFYYMNMTDELSDLLNSSNDAARGYQ